MAANTKRKVATVQLQQTGMPKLRRMRVVVQEGVSPSDTSVVAQCTKCSDSETLALELAADAKGVISRAGYAWLSGLEKNHRRCGLPKGTQGITQKLF